jgi:hypothetical protein
MVALEPIDAPLRTLEGTSVQSLRVCGSRCRSGVVAQLVVVVHVLVAERDPDDALPDQGRKRVHHRVLLAAIHKAPRRPADTTRRRLKPSDDGGLLLRHTPSNSNCSTLHLHSIRIGPRTPT